MHKVSHILKRDNDYERRDNTNAIITVMQVKYAFKFASRIYFHLWDLHR